MEFRTGNFYYEEKLEKDGQKYLAVFEGKVAQIIKPNMTYTEVTLDKKNSYATLLDNDGDGTDTVIQITPEWEKYVSSFADEIVKNWEYKVA